MWQDTGSYRFRLTFFCCMHAVACARSFPVPCTDASHAAAVVLCARSWMADRFSGGSSKHRETGKRRKPVFKALHQELHSWGLQVFGVHRTQ